MEIYVLVDTKQPLIFKILTIAALAAGTVGLLLTLMGLFSILPIAVVLIVVGVILLRSSYEYEYSYFDGDLRFARINNKSSRKKLPGYKMGEVLMIAPTGHDSVAHYEKEPNAKIRRLTSGNPDAKVYVMAVKGERGAELVYFEPDDRYLDEVCKKYGQKVRR